MPGPDKRISPNQKNEPIAAPLSRRQLFPTLIGGGAIFAAAFSLAKTQMAKAQPKASKKTAKYQDHPNKGEQCAICRYFHPPHTCQLVAGNISPNGWCTFFAKKTG